MKIIYLHQYFITPSAHGGTRSYEMARRWVEKGHKVVIFTSDTSTSEGDWYKTNEGHISVWWLPVAYNNKLSYSKRIWAFIKFALLAGSKAAKEGGDIIFATSTPLTIIIPALVAKIKLKVPIVFEVRDLWPELPIAIGALKNTLGIWLARILETISYTYSNAIVALSPGMAEGVKNAGVQSSKIHTIPNSCDNTLFSVPDSEGKHFRSQYAWLNERPMVLYAGTFGHINGVSYLVEVAHAMRTFDANVCFVIMGDGVEREKIESLASLRGVLNTNLFLLPPVAKKDMPAVFNAANLATSLFIDLPEMWANSANKFFDALSASKPVAINYKGWQKDLLIETGAGLVLPPNDFNEAARITHDFLKDADAQKKASTAAKHLATTQFDRDILATKLLNVLESVVQK